MRTRGTGGNIDEPRETRRTHSIAIRKQTTARPEKIPIRTARNKNSWSSRNAKMRLLQDRQVAQRFRTERLELWEIGSGFVSGVAGGEVVKLIGSYHSGCGRSTKGHNRCLAVLHIAQRPRPPSQKPTTSLSLRVPDTCADCVPSNRSRSECFALRPTRDPMSHGFLMARRRFGVHTQWRVLGRSRWPSLPVSLFGRWKGRERTESEKQWFWRLHAFSQGLGRRGFHVATGLSTPPLLNTGQARMRQSQRRRARRGREARATTKSETLAVPGSTSGREAAGFLRSFVLVCPPRWCYRRAR